MNESTDSDITYDPQQEEVHGPGYAIKYAGQHIRDTSYLHIYLYEDQFSRFYFIVERLKMSEPEGRVFDTGICDVRFIGFHRNNEPGYLRLKDIAAEHKRVALPNIQRGMRAMEIPTFGRPREVHIGVK
jgi:hypothetical protein